MRRMSGAAPAIQSFQDCMAQAWRSFDRPILLLLSERDLTAQEFVEHVNSSTAWAGWNTPARVAQHTLQEADHTCSARVSARQYEELTRRWLQLLS